MNRFIILIKMILKNYENKLKKSINNIINHFHILS